MNHEVWYHGGVTQRISVHAVLKDLCSGKERAPLPIQMGNINLLRPQIELKSEVGGFDLDFG